jgi:hypothetical protein
MPLKNALMTTPGLALPNASDPFILDTEASNFAIGAKRSREDYSLF